MAKQSPKAVLDIYRDPIKPAQPVVIHATSDGFRGVYVSIRIDACNPLAALTLTNAEALELASVLEALVQKNGGVL